MVKAFRRSGTPSVSKQTITLQKAPSARSTALMIVRPTEHRTADQTAFLDQLCQSDPTVATAFTLAQACGQLLRKREGSHRLEQWKAAVQASGIRELMDFVDGLADDAEAVANACSESWNNGMVEGFISPREMDQTQLLWTSRISAAPTPCEARIQLPGNQLAKIRDDAPRHPLSIS
jgi:transposase